MSPGHAQTSKLFGLTKNPSDFSLSRLVSRHFRTPIYPSTNARHSTVPENDNFSSHTSSENSSSLSPSSFSMHLNELFCATLPCSSISRLCHHSEWVWIHTDRIFFFLLFFFFICVLNAHPNNNGCCSSYMLSPSSHDTKKEGREEKKFRKYFVPYFSDVQCAFELCVVL